MAAKTTTSLRDELLQIIAELPEKELERIASAVHKAQQRAARRQHPQDIRKTGVFSGVVEGRYRERSDDVRDMF